MLIVMKLGGGSKDMGSTGTRDSILYMSIRFLLARISSFMEEAVKARQGSTRMEQRKAWFRDGIQIRGNHQRCNLLDGYGLGIACVPGRSTGATMSARKRRRSQGRVGVAVEGEGCEIRTSSHMDFQQRRDLEIRSPTAISAPTPAPYRAGLRAALCGRSRD
ncbi:hypothetical protein VTI74DRAFT_7177 [Chaetomium olivicolor]